MARPKTGKPPKQKLTLTVSPEAREILAALSEQRGMSISALVEEWAIKETDGDAWSNVGKSLAEFAEVFDFCMKNGITSLGKEAFHKCCSLSTPIAIPNEASELPVEAFPDEDTGV